MNPFSDLLLLFLSALLLFLGFFLTMARILFSTTAAHYDPALDNSDLVKKIKKAYDAPGFAETISFGRFAVSGISLLILRSLTLPLFEGITPPPLRIAIQLVAIIPLIYGVVIFAPGIIAPLYPYAFRHLTWIVFRFQLLLFAVPGKLSHKLRSLLLMRGGHDPDHIFLTEDEWRKLEDDNGSLDDDPLEEDERRMIHNIFEIGDTTAVSIMTPRIDMDALPVTADLETVTASLNREKRSRMPVYDGTIDHVVGILHTKDFTEWLTRPVRGEFQLRRMLRPAYFVPESKSIVEMLREMRHKRNHIAIVVDEFGGTNGLVTFEDIIEEIVGEVYDEQDTSNPRVEELRPGLFLVDPQIPLDDLTEELKLEDFDLEEKGDELDVETLGGLMQALLGAIPRKGSHVTIGPLQLRVLKVDGLRIVRMMVRLPTREPTAEEKNETGEEPVNG